MFSLHMCHNTQLHNTAATVVRHKTLVSHNVYALHADHQQLQDPDEDVGGC